jgi:acyl-CoA synthetase (AMP-forming)/AMP-acid ligase II
LRIGPPSGTVLRTTANRPPAGRTLPHILRRQAALYGSRQLVEIGAQTWSFVETLEMAARFGGTLHAAGIERGDHVAVMCGNRRESLQVYLGCGWIGAVTVPINTASRECSSHISWRIPRRSCWCCVPNSPMRRIRWKSHRPR